MAIGIMVASFVVSTLLVPALTALVGTRAWWPSRRGREPTRLSRKQRPTLRPVADSK
jgi:RND superfamily putative drug exporter